MKILYLTPFDMRESIASSGTVVSVYKSLVDAGNEVISIDNLKIPKVYGFVRKVQAKLCGKKVELMREPYVLKRMMKEVSRRSEGADFDIVFSQTSVLCAYYKENKPIVFYTDAALAGMWNYYWNPKEWLKSAYKNANRTEKLALEKCNVAIYASKWAADSAVNGYGIKSDKCLVVNRGANISHRYDGSEIKQSILERNIITQKQPYKFLFVGRDWVRKGGPGALEVVKLLNERGYTSELIVVGCKPNLHSEEEKYVRAVGFLDKNDENQCKKLHEFYLTSDFYLQPSMQECQGIAYAEASAFGLPVFAVDTGGVSGIVTKKNGHLFGINAGAEAYADKIIEYIKDTEQYIELANSAFDFYSIQLNWSYVGEKLTEILEKVLDTKK